MPPVRVQGLALPPPQQLSQHPKIPQYKSLEQNLPNKYIFSPAAPQDLGVCNRGLFGCMGQLKCQPEQDQELGCVGRTHLCFIQLDVWAELPL